MSPRFFRRPLALAAAVTFSLPLLAAATPAIPPKEPAPQSGPVSTSQPQSDAVDPARPAVVSTDGAHGTPTLQPPTADRQGTPPRQGDEEQAVKKALTHSSSGLRALGAGDRAQAQRELEASISILLKLPGVANPDAHRLQLIEQTAALRAALAAVPPDEGNQASEQEEEADTEESPDLVIPEAEPGLESPEIKPDSLSEPDLSKFDVPIVLNEKVKAYIVFFQTTKKKLISEALDRSGRYLPMMREIFQEQGLPLDLVNLAYIESGFKYRAFSRAKAAGIWQFMKSTGKRYRLEVNHWLDERRDPEKATRAAAAYLKELFGMFDSWPLALASYNAGEQRVQRARVRQGTDDFWSLKLPRETKLFVPAFMAMTIIAKDPERYGFTSPVEEAWKVERAAVPGAIALHHIARAIDATPDKIRDLNPALRHGVTPVNYREYEVNLPSGTKELLLAQVDQLPRTRPREVVRAAANEGGNRYRVRPGDTLGKIASRHGTKSSQLASLNGMRVDDTLRVGVLLNLPQGRQQTERPIASTPVNRSRTVVSVAPKPAAPVRSPVHVVRRGDTLSGIAKAYAVTPEELRRWNDLGPRVMLQPGQSLRVAIHAPKTTAEAGGASKVSERPVRYRVKRGDTLWEIAKSHDVTPEELRRWNDLTHRAKLRVGQELTIHLDRS
jgi:membrane-bound lytic murein transglycosylase D